MDIDKKQLNIAKNYSEALLKIGKEQDDAEKLYNQLGDVVSTINNSDDLKKFLMNPLISENDKKEIIYKVFGKDFDLQIINLLNLLADNKRLSLIPTVYYTYEKEYEEYKNILEINIISAVTPNNSSKTRLKNILEKKLNKQIIFNYEINENILGGLIIKIGDKIIDLSLAKKIKDLEKQLI